MKLTKLTINDFIVALRDKIHGFSFGDPWRLDEKSLAAVIPIIRVTEKQRTYMTLSEATHVSIFDTGNIGEVVVENGENVAVFIRFGEILKGSTQERAAVHSVIVMPHTKQNVTVRCVHASQGIHARAEMKPGGYVPREVEGALYESNQSTVWSGTERFAMAALKSAEVYAHHGYADVNASSNFREVPRDDLTRTCITYGRLIDNIIKKVPLVDNQIGMAIVDRHGFDALEVFDVPISWKILRDSIVKGAGVTLSDFDDDGVFVYRPEKMVAAILKSLDTTLSEQTVYSNGAVRVVKLASPSLLGEAVIMDDDVLHLRLFKNNVLPWKPDETGRRIWT